MPVKPPPPLTGAVKGTVTRHDDDTCDSDISFISECERLVCNWYWESDLPNQCSLHQMCSSLDETVGTLSTYAEESTDQSNASIVNEHFEAEGYDDYGLRLDPLPSRLDIVSRLNSPDAVHVRKTCSFFRN